MAPVMQEPNVVWDSNRKFREASAVTKTINEHLSGLGMREYKTAMKALHNIATLFKHGQFDVILDASEQRLECHEGELFGDTEFADALSENDSNSVVNEASAGVLEGAEISHSVQPTQLRTASCQSGLGADSPGLGSFDAQTDLLRPLAQSAARENQLKASADLLVAPADNIGITCDMSVTSGAQLESNPNQLASSGAQLGSSGAQLESSGAQLGSSRELGSSGAQLGSSRAPLGPSEAQLGIDEPSEVCPRENTVPPLQTLQRTIALDDDDDDFEILSPPKSRGRPKEKPKSVKAKQNLGIAIVQEDMEMHEKQLNLASLQDLFAAEPTFNSSNEVLLQFRKFVFLKKPRVPTAYLISKLPVGKPLLTLEEICRVLPSDLIAKCAAKVSAYQGKQRGVREMDIALDISGVGVLPNNAIALMKKWLRAVKVLRKVTTALGWIAQIKFAGHETGSFAIEKDPDLPEKLKSIPIMTSKATILDWTARQLISDEAMMDVLSRKYGSASGISVIDPSSLGVVVEGTVRAPRKDIQRGLASLSTEKVLVPLNCGGNHCVRAVAQTMLDLLPPGAHKTFRARIYDPGLGIQSDNYNCGIYVLLAFEIFCEAEPLGLVNRSMLQCMRYRYLRMCL
ncbi:hypothetical protein PR002_g24495 [Phytophthora rubi]|uniref:Ubiquitin-like protease family profile domain-containing protein n=1 Tax=Phytophthora rubi TaxID=129364 RepID=A0A6A3IGB1_9STRA|nr:hypothetical protein PR002_g24495 [Phytophthora rubi]